MDSKAIMNARGNLQAVAYDVAYSRSSLKGLLRLAEHEDLEHEMRQIHRAMDALDAASKILSDVRIFHPTLF